MYLALQTLAQFAIASLLGLGALPWMPRRYAPLDRDAKTGPSRVPMRGFVALAGVLLYLSFVVAVWVYVEPLARERSIDARAIAVIAPLSLAMQVVGAGLATLLAGRLPALATLLVVGAANLVLIAVMATTASAFTFLTAVAAFGFLWLFALPFQVPVVIAADPSRGAASLIGGAQLIGSSVGPWPRCCSARARCCRCCGSAPGA